MIVYGKNEVASMDEFIQKASKKMREKIQFGWYDDEYEKCEYSEAYEGEVQWLYNTFESMDKTVIMDIGKPLKVLCGTVTPYDNVWCVETEDMFYYIFWANSF
jgi:hypothetical protein